MHSTSGSNRPSRTNAAERRARGADERRRTAEPAPSSPEGLIDRHVEDARRQLAEGREQLKQARRRVVQLEDAVANWERLAGELRAGRRNGSPASR
jgi:hypothetical protein